MKKAMLRKLRQIEEFKEEKFRKDALEFLEETKPKRKETLKDKKKKSDK